MANGKYVPGDLLISYVANELNKEKKIKPPEWAIYVKTGITHEKPPLQEDWVYIRAASMLRKIYIKGPIGISQLSSEYGGKEDNGSKRYHAEKGSRSIIRYIFHELETAGYTEKSPKGRILTSAGQSLIDKASKEIIKNLAEKNPLYEKFI